MTRPRRWLRVVGVLAVIAIAAPALLVGWLLRDPTPVFDARRGALVAAEVAAPSATGAADVALASTTGLTVHLRVRPATHVAPGERAPLFLILGGHVRGRGAVDLVPELDRAVVAALEYPYAGDHRATGAQALRQIPAIRRALYDTPPAVALALDHLLARDDVDTTRVELVGASFGVIFGSIAAARDQRITRLWLAHGGGDTRAMINRGLEDEIPWGPARAVAAQLVDWLASGPRFTPERWIADVAPRPVVMLNARDDERIPLASVERLWQAAREPKERVWLSGQHVQGTNRPDELAALVGAIRDRAFGATTAPAPR